ncbi:MAG: hypothetical protein WCQ00_03270 [bacterium]
MSHLDEEIAKKMARLLDLDKETVARLTDIIKTKTAVEARGAYDRAARGSTEKAFAEQHWDHISMEAVKSATTCKDLGAATSEARDGSKALYVGFKRLHDRCLTSSDGLLGCCSK